MKVPDRIRQFLLEKLGSMVGEWVAPEGGNGQIQIKITGVVSVSYYTTIKAKGKTLWQGKQGTQYEKEYRRWLGNQKASPAATNNAQSGSSAAQRAPTAAPPNKGQRSTQNECEAFMLELEHRSSGNVSNLWEKKENGQLFARFCHLGDGNMSFWPTKPTHGTLLFQGRDLEDIKAKFYQWRRERLQSFQRECDSSGSGITDEGPAKKRQKVDEKKERASVQSMKIGAMREELLSYGVSTDLFLERSEFERALNDARKAQETNGGGKKASSSSDQRDDAQDQRSKPSHSFSQHSSSNKRPFGRSSDERVCKYCNRLISRHRQFEGETMCFLSGRYKCSCGRWWKGMALKIQHKALEVEDEKAFPPHTFPDCKTCKENSNVVLSELLSKESSSDDRAGGGHQADLCKLCQKGIYCPRA